MAWSGFQTCMILTKRQNKPTFFLCASQTQESPRSLSHKNWSFLDMIISPGGTTLCTERVGNVLFLRTHLSRLELLAEITHKMMQNYPGKVSALELKDLHMLHQDSLFWYGCMVQILEGKTIVFTKEKVICFFFLTSIALKSCSFPRKVHVIAI